MASIPSPPEFTFNPADTRLKITYKDRLAYANVSSGAMAQVSSVWKNIVDFTQDDADALLILLSITHLRFDDVLIDQRPPRKVLINLAIFCQEYRCQELLWPWIGSWMNYEFRDYNGYGGQCKSGNTEEDHKAMILLEWVFDPTQRSTTLKKVWKICIDTVIGTLRIPC